MSSQKNKYKVLGFPSDLKTKKITVYFAIQGINSHLGKFILHQKEREHFSLRLSKYNSFIQPTLCKVCMEFFSGSLTHGKSLWSLIFLITLCTQEVPLPTPRGDQSPRKECHVQYHSPRSYKQWPLSGNLRAMLHSGKLDSQSKFPGGSYFCTPVTQRETYCKNICS